ncbi:MAG: YihY/virulence factor BrkB family protein [Bdellovibrionales bacterium]|nr:YihY/virulence factor BrkB family protein [Bdellovibrionales bacterium]
MHWRDLGPIFRNAAYEWSEDKVPRMAGALAFYTVFSLTPVVIIAVSVAGTFVGREEALEAVYRQAEFLVGPKGVEAIQLLVRYAPQNESSLVATALGLLTMFFGATGAFTELQDALDTIWEVRPKPGLGIVDMIRDRFLSFALVLVIGFLLLVSLVISATLDSLNTRVTDVLPDRFQWLQMAHSVTSLAVITVLFALIYKVLPDATVAWRNVWLGALVAAALFVVGKKLFSLYLGHSTVGSSYGAAGSLVIVVLWTYYSACIVLFGAEITQVQARLRGERIEPAEHAVVLNEHERLQQGITHLTEVQKAAYEQESLAEPESSAEPLSATNQPDLAERAVASTSVDTAVTPPSRRLKRVAKGLLQIVPVGVGVVVGWFLSSRLGKH